MLFWIVAAALTLIGCLAVLVPYMRGGRQGTLDAAYDLEVYADQLRSIEGELERGVLPQADAELARAEIGRKLLNAKAKLENPAHRALQQRFASVSPVVATAAVLLVPVVSWGAYTSLGRPDLPSAPLAARLAKPPQEAGIAELVAKAERHLAANPQDGQGWEVLAPVYMRMQRYEDAATAFRNAIRINGTTVERQTGLGEALVIVAQGMVTAEAETAFRAALDVDKTQPVARFYLATAKMQQGRNGEAGAELQALLKDSPADAPWRPAVEAALRKMRGGPAVAGAGTETGTGASAPGPSAEEIEAAGNMAPADQMVMIEGMVAQLNEKLTANPDDLPGWQRLIRSYAVLGKRKEAGEALGRALAAFAGDEAKKAEIENFARALNIGAGAGG